MSFFKRKENIQKEYCLIGLSKFNLHISQVLKNEGQKVTLIDIDPEVINAHGNKFDFAIVGDASNLKDLRDISVRIYDYVIVGVDDIETSITICSNLKELNVEKIMAKTKNAVHQRILKNMGIFLTIIPEIEIAEKMAYLTMYDLNVELFSFDSTAKNIFIIRVPVYNLDLVMKQIKDLSHLRSLNATIISIKRFDGEVIVPVSGEDHIKKSDNVSVICDKNSIKEVKDYFMKNIPVPLN